MAIQKAIVLNYQSKNFKTGLTDVKATAIFNGVEKAVGASAIALTETDPTNLPGFYQATIPAATLTSWGALQTGSNVLTGQINSASQNAPSGFDFVFTVASVDDIDIKLGAPAGASVSADIAAVKADTAATRVDLESSANSLSTILAAVQAIQNNAGFAMAIPTTLIKPLSGSNAYRGYITVYNAKNALVDPDTNSILVTLVNQAGADRSSYLVGNSSGSAPAVRDSVGNYHIDLSIPSTAAQEELTFGTSYAIGGAATSRRTTTEIITDVQADGFALQTTSLAIQTAVTTINSLLTDPTNGLANIESQIANGTYGLNALQTLINTIQSSLNNAGYGLNAIQTAVGVANSALANATYGLSALQVQSAGTQGVGFVAGTDDLHSLSTYLRANLYSGGRAF